ncbi:MAG TPA: hypothetical protein VGQ37_17310 [Vicinamibacterales bacterium]|nr:hypothetical protein [Vicinamibacterales bacterium]
MKILFSTSSYGFLRNFQSSIRRLAEQGHHIHLLAERSDTVDGQKMADALVAEHPDRITASFLRSSRHRLWHTLGTGLRASLDYWRYLDPRWDDSPKLRARGASMAPAFARRLPDWPILGSRAALAALTRLFHAIDRRLPPPAEVAEVFARERPDLLLLTPLLYFRSHQVDHVRYARSAGVKSIVGIGSWDHLTTKGLIHEVPDRVLVWNEAQKQEAIDLHGVPGERVVVTGSQAYDHWFDMGPSVDRDAFCARVGLDPARPILLYLCSSSFIAPYEAGFVRSWVQAIRASGDPWVRSAGLLVRPHPQNAEQWQPVDLAAEFANVSVWPKAGMNPIGGAARHEYFDSMYHAEAVIGVNTSGMIESGIIGRPVYAVQVTEFAATQDGTLHFQHLKNVDGGLLHLAGTLDEHVAQLARIPVEGEAGRQKVRRFIGGFVRPHGLDVAATPRVVAAVEDFAAAPPLAPASPPAGARLVRVLLAPVAVTLTLTTMDRVKRRAVILHWIRPARLFARGVFGRLVYLARLIRRLPRLGFRLAVGAVRLLVVRPALWARHRAKTALHAFLVWRKGETGEAG